MSLIADALKTAQREKERRESREGPSASSVLIPLREPRRRFDPRLGLGILTLSVAITVGLYVRSRSDKSSLPALPTVATAMISEAIASRTETPRAAAPSPRSRGMQGAPQPSPRVAVISVGPVNPAASADDTPAVPQGQPDSSARPAAPAAPPGELRVAVESRASAGRLFAQAVAAHRAGDIPSARSLYERVLAVEPDHADALNNVGIILSGEQEYDRALELLRRAAALAPRNAATWNNIGTVLREQGKSADAIAAFRHALGIDPQHLGARVGLAQQYVAIDNLPEARTLLEQIMATTPSYAEAHYTLGQVLERQGDRVSAIREYQAFVSTAPARLAGHAERVRRYIETLSR